MRQQPIQTEPILLRGEEVAHALQVSRAKAYRMMQRGTIPVVRIPGGKAVRVPRVALLQWINEQTRRPEVSV